MTDIIIAIPIDVTPSESSIYYCELTASSSQWESAIKCTLKREIYDAIHFLGPKGLPVVSSAFVVYRCRSQKRKGDRLLGKSGLGRFCAEDPLNLGPHVTLFMRPDDDWKVEMPAKGHA